VSAPLGKILLFLKKKKQKDFLFVLASFDLERRVQTNEKFFGSFFQKRTAYLNGSATRGQNGRVTLV